MHYQQKSTWPKWSHQSDCTRFSKQEKRASKRLGTNLTTRAGAHIAFHLSVNGQKLVTARVMGRSRPNFSPKLEPIHRTRAHKEPISQEGLAGSPASH